MGQGWQISLLNIKQTVWTTLCTTQVDKIKENNMIGINGMTSYKVKQGSRGAALHNRLLQEPYRGRVVVAVGSHITADYHDSACVM